MKQSFVYIMTNKSNRVLYTGMTGNLIKRVYQHKNKLVEGFTKKYSVTKLVHYGVFDDIKVAAQYEKKIKSGSRAKKIALIENLNKDWTDLYDTIL
jgi:putative endonuclease